MLLLARKGDGDYWSGINWAKHETDRRVWSADITRRMLQEGSVATGYADNTDGIVAAMSAAADPMHGQWQTGPHALTGVVAQIRGLRLMQSMAPNQSTDLQFGGYYLSDYSLAMLHDRFGTALRVYRELPHRLGGNPPAVMLGPQPTAGHATNINGDDIFVGEHSDLLWRALTETDNDRWSPLKTAVLQADTAAHLDEANDLICAAALHDDTAQQQLTTGLFDGIADATQRRRLKRNIVTVLEPALNRSEGEDWTVEQQTRLRSFVVIVEALNP